MYCNRTFWQISINYSINPSSEPWHNNLIFAIYQTLLYFVHSSGYEIECSMLLQHSESNRYQKGVKLYVDRFSYTHAGCVDRAALLHSD